MRLRRFQSEHIAGYPKSIQIRISLAITHIKISKNLTKETLKKCAETGEIKRNKYEC